MKPFDPIGALANLVAHGVEMVLIGGLAARLRGSPTITDDLDICHSKAPANLARLVAALNSAHAVLRGAEDVEFRLDDRFLESADNFTFQTDFGAFDCLAFPAGVGGYEELLGNSDPVELGGMLVPVASIDDLMKMKEGAGRPKDRIELEILGALKAEIEGRD